MLDTNIRIGDRVLSSKSRRGVKVLLRDEAITDLQIVCRCSIRMEHP